MTSLPEGKKESPISYQPKLVSIIILVWDEKRFTRQTLESIKAKTEYQDYEVIVVDNGSKKLTCDYLKTCGLIDKLIRLKENVGFPQAVNIGIKHSRGEYILLANNDILLTKGWLTKLTDVVGDDETIGMVSPLRLQQGRNGYEVIILNHMPADFPQINIGERDTAKKRTTAKLNMQIEEYNQEITEHYEGMYFTKGVAFAPFFCVLFRRNIFDEIGMLDEDFGWGLHEDVAYCKLMLDAGHKIAIALSCFVFHYMSISIFKLFGGYEGAVKAIEENSKILGEKWKKIN